MDCASRSSCSLLRSASIARRCSVMSSPEESVPMTRPRSSRSTTLRQAISLRSPLRVTTSCSAYCSGSALPSKNCRNMPSISGRSSPGRQEENQFRPTSSSSGQPRISQPLRLTSETVPLESSASSITSARSR